MLTGGSNLHRVGRILSKYRAMNTRGISSTITLASLILLVGSFSACGGSATTTPSTPPGSVPAATTTLRAETANNTSASDSFVRQSNGNAGAGSVSKLPIRSLLYSGADTKIYVTWLGWFGRPDHMSVGYNSADASQVHRQVEDMISRGIQGAIAAWYGSGSAVINDATKLLRSEAELHAGQFEFAIMEDVGALGSAAEKNGCDVTDQLISDLGYVASQYESSSAYMRSNGRPVVFFFGVDAYYIDWNRVISSIPGNPLLIFQGPGGLSRDSSDGGFSWVNLNQNNPFDIDLSAQDTFYQTAKNRPDRLVFGTAYKGFNDTLAAWGANRVVNQQCGQAWRQTFSEVGKFYSSAGQLPRIQIATWNDYEEGTAIEPGIDNCIYLTPSQTGSTISWAVHGGDESTIDHYTVFLSTDGANLAKLGDVPSGTHTFDLSRRNLATHTYSIYVEAIGAPSFQNKMSPVIAYHPGDQPPAFTLDVSQNGPLTYTASTGGASGNITRAVIDFGDGTVVDSTSSSHTYSTVGSYVISASAYDAAGASTVATQQVSVKPSSQGITVVSPSNGATVNWPTTLVASANPSTPVSVLRVLIDGQQAYATNSDTLNTALKIFTGSHQISIQSLDGSGNITASKSFTVVAEPNDEPPIAKITFRSLPGISPTTVLGCAVNSSDPDGFLSSIRVQYSDGSQFFSPAALETFPATGSYSAHVTVMDQFGATDDISVTFSVHDGTVDDVTPLETPQPQNQEMPLQPMGPP